MAKALSTRTEDQGRRDRPIERESTERFDPEAMAGGLLEAEHRARYWWASRIASGKFVLDAGCGTGYGTRMLASAGARKAVGVDISEEAIADARRSQGDAADFQVADLRALPVESGAVDLVVCFEVIEHIGEREQVLSELKRVLGEGGVLLISSPNRHVYLPGNPHHVYEYEPDELRRELARFFSNVELYRQHSWIATAVMTDADFSSARADHELRISTHKLVPHDPAQETYTVAAASDRPIQALQSLGVLGEPFEVRAWQDRDEERTRSLEELKSYIAWLEEKQREGIATAAELRKSLWEAHELLLERDKALIRAQGTRDAQEELKRAAMYARSLESEITALKEYQESLTEEVGRVTSENGRILRELDSLKQTRVMRVATRYWHLRERLRATIGRDR